MVTVSVNHLTKTVSDMARQASQSLTEREAQIMDVVWRLGEVNGLTL